MKQIDLTNKRFGHLVPIEYIGASIWECICDCGNHTQVHSQYLRNGNIKSCGCINGVDNNTNNKRTTKPKNDLAGITFGYLTPLYYIKGGAWHCKCKCGNEVNVPTHYLTSGHTTSCGCYVKENNSKNNTIDMSGYEDENIKVIKRAGSTPLGIARWECVCKHCGRVFVTEGATIRCGDTKSCGCVHSLNEIKIIQMFLENNIEFDTQHKFPDLFGKDGIHPLRFDFAVFNNGQLSHLIEYNGKQHYEKPEGSWSDGFETLKENDEKKRQYCIDHNIELRIIKYDQDYTLEDLI